MLGWRRPTGDGSGPVTPEAPALRTLLGLAAGGRGARRGSRARAASAFVSASLRPYVIAALAEFDERARGRPAMVVVGDDRAARDLAADLRAWLAPRRVRYYPSRGVAYESHLAPPPHLVGLRVAALDALLADAGAGEEPPVVVVSAVALSEKVPDPSLRPHSFTLRVGELLDLDECAAELVGMGYERVDQVEERGQFALRGGLLDVFPATEERAVRVDMFDVEIESLRWFSTFTQRSLGDVEEVEIAPAAELAAEHRELAEIAAATRRLRVGGGRRGRRAPGHRRPAARRALRRAARPGRRRDGADRRGRGGARAGAARPLDRRLGGVRRATTPSHLYVSPESIEETLARAGADLAVGGLERAGDRAARTVGRHGRALAGRGGARAREARPLGLPHGGRVPAARARASAPPTTSARLKATWLGEDVDVGRATACSSPRCGSPPPRCSEGFVAPRSSSPCSPSTGCCAAAAPSGPARRGTRRRAPPGRAALLHRAAHRRHRRARGPRGGALRRLRDAHRRERHARLPVSRIPGRRPRVRAHRPAREDLALRRRRRRASAAEQARRHALGHDEGARAPRRTGAGGRAAEPLRRAAPADRACLRARLGLAARVRGALPVHRDGRPARGDRARQGRHGGAAADGPADLRRRRLRQDRGRAAGGVQGRGRGQAGADARADDDPRPAALRHLRRAARRLSVHGRARLALPQRRPSRKPRSRASPRGASTS